MTFSGTITAKSSGSGSPALERLSSELGVGVGGRVGVLVGVLVGGVVGVGKGEGYKIRVLVGEGCDKDVVVVESSSIVVG